MKYFNLLFPYLVQNLVQIKTSAFWACFSGLITTIALEVFTGLKTFASQNIDYFSIALGIIAFDHIAGSVVHLWYKKDFDRLLNVVGFCIKLFVVIAAGYLFEGIAHLTKEEDFLYIYIKMTGRLIVCWYPGRSLLRNLIIISKGGFKVDAVIDKIDNFNDDLDIEKFKNKEQL